MDQTLKVGDVRIGQNFINCPYRNGMQYEIIGGLENRIGKNTTTGVIREALLYKVLWENGDVTEQRPFYLRKRRPPQSYTGELTIRRLLDAAPVNAPERVGS